MKRPSAVRFAMMSALAATLTASAGCKLGQQSAPPLSGPSSYGLSVTMHATPDRLTQDGVSTTTVTAVVQDATGKAVTNLPVQWDVTASDGRTFVEPSWRTSLTDGNGTTTVQVTSPPAPPELPTRPLTLTVSATPFGDDIGNATPRQVNVGLLPPLGTQPVNRNPQASFTVSPASPGLWQVTTFDASTTTDEGVACPNCTYNWDFGDGSTGSGVTATHSFSTGGTFNVTLTGRDARGGIGTTARTITVSAPGVPIAAAPVHSPTGNRPAGSVVVFDGGASTVGAGATIGSYTWIWNDGTESTVTQTPQTTHIFATPGTFVVRLIITDNFGRTATSTVAITII